MVTLGSFLVPLEFTYDEDNLTAEDREILEAFVRYKFPDAATGQTVTPETIGECMLLDEVARQAQTYLTHNPTLSYFVKCEEKNYIIEVALGYPAANVSIRNKEQHTSSS
jgi:hypothetical protein